MKERRKEKKASLSKQNQTSESIQCRTEQEKQRKDKKAKREKKEKNNKLMIQFLGIL